MAKSLPQSILGLSLVTQPAHASADHPPSTPARPPAQDEAQHAGSLIVAAPVAVAVEEHQTPQDPLAEVRAFNAPDDSKTTMMTAYGFPVLLEHAVEALAREAERRKQHTVAALLDRGFRTLWRLPGLKACLEGRQELLKDSRDPHVHRWLAHVVAVDLPTAGLGHTRFGVRVAVAQHGILGLIAGALGIPKGQCLTLALTAALLGSPYVALDAANEAMFRTLVDLRDRCEERARHTERLLSEMRLSARSPGATTVRRTIDDVLAGHPG